MTIPMTSGTHGRRCAAHSSRTGEPCAAWAVRGANVCVTHGARAPQVKAKAEDRIRDMVDPALNRLLLLIASDQDSTALAAVKDILDRAGYAAKQRIEVTVRQHAEKLAADLGLDPDELIAEAERIVAASLSQ